jgi:hypothetical protein
MYIVMFEDLSSNSSSCLSFLSGARILSVMWDHGWRKLASLGSALDRFQMTLDCRHLQCRGDQSNQSITHKWFRVCRKSREMSMKLSPRCRHKNILCTENLLVVCSCGLVQLLCNSEQQRRLRIHYIGSACCRWRRHMKILHCPGTLSWRPWGTYWCMSMVQQHCAQRHLLKVDPVDSRSPEKQGNCSWLAPGIWQQQQGLQEFHQSMMTTRHHILTTTHIWTTAILVHILPEEIKCLG